MNKTVLKYRRRVIRAMCCPGHIKKNLLRNLDALLDSFQEEEPDADEAEVLRAFGAPAELADTLCEGIADVERRRWKRIRRLRIVICVVLCAGLIVLISAHMALQTDPAPIYMVQETNIS